MLLPFQVSRDDEADNIDGFYIGYKPHGKSDPYNFRAINISTSVVQHCIISGLTPLTDYSFIVQAFNGRGAGPPSEPALVRTLEFGEYGFVVIL